jgi:hypothetical protein
MKWYWSAASITAVALASVAAISAVVGWHFRNVNELPDAVVGRPN